MQNIEIKIKKKIKQEVQGRKKFEITKFFVFIYHKRGVSGSSVKIIYFYFVIYLYTKY